MIIYVATTTTNYREARRVMAHLRQRGHTISYDWTRARRMSIGDLGKRELRGVLESDALILILPGLLGSHTEPGIALGVGKPCLVCGDHGHRLSSANVPFYFCDNVRLLFANREQLAQRIAEEVDSWDSQWPGKRRAHAKSNGRDGG